MNGFGIDWQEVIRRALKYLFEGLAVGLASMYLIKNNSLESAVMVGITSSAIYALTDAYSPSIGASARLGTGLQLGSAVVGGF